MWSSLYERFRAAIVLADLAMTALFLYLLFAIYDERQLALVALVANMALFFNSVGVLHYTRLLPQNSLTRASVFRLVYVRSAVFVCEWLLYLAFIGHRYYFYTHVAVEVALSVTIGVLLLRIYYWLDVVEQNHCISYTFEWRLKRLLEAQHPEVTERRSKLTKTKAKRTIPTVPRSKPLSAIAKKNWRRAAAQPLCEREQNLLAAHIRELIGQIAPFVCIKVDHAPGGFPTLITLTKDSSVLLDEQNLLHDLKEEEERNRKGAAKRFHLWMHDQLLALVGLEAAVKYSTIAAKLVLPVLHPTRDGENNKMGSSKEDEQKEDEKEYRNSRSALHELADEHSDTLPFTTDEFVCILDMVLFGDVEDRAYHFIEDSSELNDDDDAHENHLPIPLDLLLSVASGSLLSGLLENGLLPWKTVADNLDLCNELALVGAVSTFEPYPGYGQILLDRLIEDEAVDSYIPLVSAILQRKLTTGNATWIPRLLRQLCSAAADKESNFRRYSSKTADEIIANLIDCFKDFVSPGWATEKLLGELCRIDDGKWLPRLCSGKHWRPQDIKRLCGNEVAKLCIKQ